MEFGRKITEQETNEIIADMVRLYRLDKNLMPDMQDREDIIGHEKHTDEEEAKYWLSQARVVITDMDEKAGVIFWGGECGGYPSILREKNDGKLYIVSQEMITMYWGR